MKNTKLSPDLIRRIKMAVFDFDGVFTDNRVLVMEDGTEGVFCCRGDGIGISALKETGVDVMVLSKETNPVVSKRCAKLDIPCIQACDNKALVLEQEAKSSGLSLEQVAYMGNDINDLECLCIVGLPACVADSHPDVLKASLYISKKEGGHGAVREFCDFITNIKRQKP